MRVALYARVSTERQEQQGTIASQLDALTRWAREQHHDVVDAYVCVDDGYSGTRLDRPGLDRLRDGAEAGAFKAALVLCPDRLARKYAYQILILEELERFDVRVIFLDQPLSDDPQARLLTQIQGAVAEYERIKIAERYRRGKLFRARQGEVCWGKVPYGYRRIPRRDGVPAQVEVSEPEAQVVRQIFRWHVDEHLSVRQIALRLTESPHVTATGLPRWGISTVTRMLHNEAYIGTMYYNRRESVGGKSNSASRRQRLSTCRQDRPAAEWIPLPVPPIIDAELFRRSQVFSVNYFCRLASTIFAGSGRRESRSTTMTPVGRVGVACDVQSGVENALPRRCTVAPLLGRVFHAAGAVHGLLGFRSIPAFRRSTVGGRGAAADPEHVPGGTGAAGISGGTGPCSSSGRRTQACSA